MYVKDNRCRPTLVQTPSVGVPGTLAAAAVWVCTNFFQFSSVPSSWYDDIVVISKFAQHAMLQLLRRSG